MFDFLKKKLKTIKVKDLDEEVEEEVQDERPKKPMSKLERKMAKRGKKTAQKKKVWVKVDKKELVDSDAEGGILDGKVLTEKKVDNILTELEVILLESDVAQPVVAHIQKRVRKELVGKRIKRSVDLDELIENALRNAISNALSQKQVNFDKFVKKSEKPVVIMFVGVNGTGKTTAIARIAYRLQKRGYTCVLAAGDTFRAGAIEQLEKHANNLNMKIIKNKAGSDPASVAYDAVEHAKARHKDVVLLDTAGRMQTNINLMDEMKKIRRIANPAMVIFVGDSLAGNDAIIQARKFHEAVKIDGVILTKIDSDAKGGAALSIAYSIKKPLLFVGTGQEYRDLEPFNPEWMVDRLF